VDLCDVWVIWRYNLEDERFFAHGLAGSVAWILEACEIGVNLFVKVRGAIDLKVTWPACGGLGSLPQGGRLSWFDSCARWAW
jgi:hypothetical protein